MEKYFRTQEGELVNAVEHTLQQIEKWPNLEIYIGSDSQVYNPMIRSVTCIVYRYGTRGAHYIFFIEDSVGAKDDFTRLYDEGKRTVETEEMLRRELPFLKVKQLEFDFAGEKKTLSTMMVGVFKGYQNARFKGGEMFATKAADHVCRNIFEISKTWKEGEKEKLNIARGKKKKKERRTKH